MEEAGGERKTRLELSELKASSLKLRLGAVGNSHAGLRATEEATECYYFEGNGCIMEKRLNESRKQEIKA